MDTINPLSPIKSVGTATSDTSGRQQFQQQGTPGKIITATVLESAGNNKVYLNISGKKILAGGDKVSLQPGTRLNLEILATQPVLELKIVSKTPEVLFGKTLTLLGNNLDISSLFQVLKGDVSPLPTPLSTTARNTIQNFYHLQHSVTGKEGAGAQLQQVINRLGLTLESTLAKGNSDTAGKTLKAALLEISSILREGGSIAGTANKLLGTLELFQLAQLRLSTENLLLFPLPLPFLNNGYLLVEQDQETTQTKQRTDMLRFSLHLSLDALGDIKISFLQTSEGLYIQFSCDSPEKKKFAMDSQEELKEIISNKKILGLSFTDTAENPVDDLIRRLVPSGESMLNMRV